MLTDVPTSIGAMLGGHLKPSTYFESLRTFETESVFAREDLLPSLAEVALIPYLTAKRGF
jgi:hypothetical protein